MTVCIYGWMDGWMDGWMWVHAMLRVRSQASIHLGAPAFSSTVERCLGESYSSATRISPRPPALRKRLDGRDQ